MNTLNAFRFRLGKTSLPMRPNMWTAKEVIYPVLVSRVLNRQQLDLTTNPLIGLRRLGVGPQVKEVVQVVGLVDVQLGDSAVVLKQKISPLYSLCN